MLWKIIHMGVNEEVGINQNHLNVSPSATAITSEMSSRLTNLQRPKLTERVSYAFSRRGGLVISLRPCLKAWFITIFKLELRALRTFSKSLATSSSIVSVVLMHQYIIQLMRWCQENDYKVSINFQKPRYQTFVWYPFIIMVPRDRILIALGDRTADTGIFRPIFRKFKFRVFLTGWFYSNFSSYFWFRLELFGNIWPWRAQFGHNPICRRPPHRTPP